MAPIKLVTDILPETVPDKDVRIRAVEVTAASTETSTSFQFGDAGSTRDSEPSNLGESDSSVTHFEKWAPHSYGIVSLVVHVRGPFRTDAFEKAWHALGKRHAALDSLMREREGMKPRGSQSHQEVAKLRFINIAHNDVNGNLEGLLQREQAASIEGPHNNMGASILQLNNEHHVLTIGLNNNASTCMSMEMISQELSILYREALHGTSTLQPESLEALEDRLQHQLRYWRKRLESSQPAHLFLDKPRSSTSLSQSSGKTTVKIKDSLHQNVQKLCADRKLTPFVVLLAAFRAAHYRLTGSKDATLGAPVDSIYGSGSLGLLGNIQSIRIQMDDDSFSSLFQQVNSAITNAAINRDVPYHLVSSNLQDNNDPLQGSTKILFAFHPLYLSDANIKFDGVKTERAILRIPRQFEVEFQVFQEDTGFLCEVAYSQDIYEAKTMSTLLNIFHQVLEKGVDFPDTPVSTLPLTDGLMDLKKLGLLGVKATDYPRESSLVEAFQHQVAATPDLVAVRDSATQLTFAELDEESRKIAWWLSNRLLPAETLIGVFAPRSCETLTAFLGILKAGLAYLPLDVKFPVGRIESILASVEGQKLLLLGSNVEFPSMNLSDVELVRINQTLHEKSGRLGSPSARSLAYVMFTSGSTGKPKGVMIEHRSILRLVTANSNLTQYLPRDGPIPHMSNIAFDASTWEIYTALLNGRTLVCVDSMSVLDFAALGRAFTNNGILTTMWTPALMKQCLIESPATVAALDTLLVGGERIDPEDIFAARRLVKGKVIIAYGTTEDTICSTFYPISDTDTLANGVPIGHPVSNSAAYVMDSNQSIVPLGVVGELVVTGDGLARGYTDPRRDEGRFVNVEIGKQVVRGYRTGDFVRARPSDGNLEFLGRIDSMIKLRGNRIELEEIEHVMRSHVSIDEAVVVVQQQQGQGQELVGFVTVKEADDKVEQIDGADEEVEQVQGWLGLYNAKKYLDLESIDSSIIGRDFLSWTSMYDGVLIDKGEMNEWLNDTIDAILDSGPAGKVLEVGTGSGMILFNLGEGLDHYIGIEPSDLAVSFVNKTAKLLPAFADKVEIRLGTAADVNDLNGVIAPDLVVINSVSQYFPSLDYMLRLVEHLIKLEGSGTRRIFFGDIRSFATYHQFQVTKALHGLKGTITKDELRQKLADIEQAEEELLIDPAFFTSLIERFPDLVEHVEILPKRMKATNELSCYRYAAVIHVRARKQNRQIYDVSPKGWIDFVEKRLDSDSLLDTLKQSSNGVIPISNIPYQKTFFEQQVLQSLEEKSEDADWLASADESAKTIPSLSAFDLVEISKKAGFQVELSWARQFSQHGGIDAVFHRYKPEKDKSRVLFRFPTTHAGRHISSFSTQPLRQRLNWKLEKEIISMLQAKLPTFMVPKAIRTLTKMPVNFNGKIDRTALAQDYETTETSDGSSYKPPTNKVEHAVCEEFTKILGCQVGISDNFFDCGGHSLNATRAASALNKLLDADITVSDIFDLPIVADLAKRVEETLGANYLAIPSIPYEGPVEQSFAQGRLWFLDQLHPGSSWYHIPFAWRLRGPLDLDALKIALLALEQRHETLRTTFEDRDGISLQVVHPFTPKPLKIVDITSGKGEEDLQMLLKEEDEAGFDLKTSASWKVCIYRFDNNHHVLSIILHHIIFDGWSIEVLRKELAKAYDAAIRCEEPLAQLPRLPIQYRDFSTWQKQPNQAAIHKKQLAYWVKELEGSQPAEFFGDLPRPSVLTGVAERYPVKIEGQLFQDLQAFCKIYQVTPFTVLLAAFRATHFRLTGAKDVTIGTPVANRNREDLENIIGFFVNIQPIRIAIEDESFDELIAKVQKTTTRAFSNQDVPFEKVVSELQRGLHRDLSRNPLTQILLAVHSELKSFGEFGLKGLEGEVLQRRLASRFDFELHFFQDEHKLEGFILFSTELFKHESIRVFLSVFEQVVQYSLQEPKTKIGSIPFPHNCARLDELDLINIERAEYPKECSVIEVFRQQVATHPEKVAIKDATTQLTYLELEEKSDKIAHWLMQHELTPETLVGVFSTRSCQTIVAFLGILKANLAYLPLDIKFPASRVEVLLSAITGHKFVLIGSNIQFPELHPTGLQAIQIDDILNAPVTKMKQSTIVTPGPRSLAYVMFTSGSTGMPKGVMIEHQGIIRLVKNSTVIRQLPSSHTVLHMANIAFDNSTWEIFTALLNGQTLLCIDSVTLVDYPALSRILAKEARIVTMITPALLKQYLSESPTVVAALDTILIAGDRVDPNDIPTLRRLIKGKIFNAYGPTENTVTSAAYCVTEDETCVNGVPIGRAISNSGAYVMDSHQNLVPIGVIGELVVTGDGLARGYTEPAHDINRFVAVNIAGKPVRAYRTGDYVRYRPTDGQLEFHGRIDNQYKIRGYRVELGEIEQVLLSHNLVDDAVAVIQQSKDGEKLLAVFITLRDTIKSPADILNIEDKEQRPAASNLQDLKQKVERQLHKLLQTQLPSHMVPKRIQILSRMPLNSNEKVDRKALAEQVEQTVPTRDTTERLPPRNEVERAICEELTKVLEMPIGINDDFFDLGGHSMNATRAVSGINKRLATAISVRDIFECPVISDLAHRVGMSLGSTRYNVISKTKDTRPVEQSFAQGRLWFLEKLFPGTNWYMMPFAVKINGSLSLQALNSAMHALEQRHETLRTIFRDHDGKSIQEVLPFQPRELKLINVETSNILLEENLHQDQTTAFDLTREPGWRVSVYRLSEQQHVLSVIMHHIISDGWSLDILRKELALFYAAALSGQNPISQVESLQVQYRDFSVWQRQQAQVETHQSQLDYWIKQLEGSQPAEFFCDKPRPNIATGEARQQPIAIEGVLYDKLMSFCRERQVTPFIVLLATFRAAHFRMTGCKDALIGSPIANRNRSELEDMIGFFVNVQCIRIRLEDESFAELVQQVQQTTTQAFANQDVPFERIVSEMQRSRDLSRNPLVQAAFAVHSQKGLGQFTLEGLETEQIPIPFSTRFDLEFHLLQQNHGLQGYILFAMDLYESKTIEVLISTFCQILECGLREPQTLIASLPLQSDAIPSATSCQLNLTTYPRDSSLIDVFRQQVEANPLLLAVKDPAASFTYQELDHESSKVAAWLSQQQLPAEALVAIYANRSYQTISAMLGILKAGLAYLPLDVRSPASRTQQILSCLEGRKIVLLGEGVPHPMLLSDDVEFFSITTTLSEPTNMAETIKVPSATSLAYVMFTSGSTGKPKGVMIEHRGIMRLVKASNLTDQLPATGAIAHMSNLAFDASTWEIWTSLLNGRCLICIDQNTLLDYIGLGKIFSGNQIAAAISTPALLKQCLIDCPSTISALGTLLVGGDRTDPQDMVQAQQLVKGKVINAYGPTENSVASTFFCMSESEKCVNGVPIGTALTNSGAFVMDPELQPVPVGIVGELIVTGDGLARGYTESERNVDRFVSIMINGRPIKAYRTGDYVRSRPSDGQLEFFGRMDGQVKIRGQRIEMGEIEHVLQTHAMVNDAIAVSVQLSEDQDLDLAAFVTINKRKDTSDCEDGDIQGEKQQIEEWHKLFEADKYTTLDSIQASNIGRDFIGWTSMYDGSPIPKSEMDEWLDDAVATLLNSHQPGKVFEIGTGSGMMLFNLLEGLESYVGLEPSERAVDFIRKTASSIPGLADKLNVQVGTAVDIPTAYPLITPDVVVINSVAQYFPSLSYLSRTIQDLLKFKGTRCLFFGDMRSYPLARNFHAGRAINNLGENASKESTKRRMTELERTEEELLVDPAFFTSLTNQLPDLVHHVEILPKKMKATNELSRYRYAAVVHLKQSKNSPQTIYEVAKQSVDFEAEKLDRSSLLRLLQKSVISEPILISNIPYSKTIFEHLVIQALDEDEHHDNTHGDWLASARAKAVSYPSLSAIDLQEIARLAGCCVEISWARQRSQHGALDAIFYKQQPEQKGGRVLFCFPSDPASQAMANQPLQQQLHTKIEKELFKKLQSQLPAYMVPKTISILSRMPMNSNGKTDRRLLADTAKASVTVRESPMQMPPRNDVEHAVCEEFNKVLGTAVIGITDNFFEFGGHSLSATRAVSGINKKLGANITVRDIFQCPAASDLAARISTTIRSSHYYFIPSIAYSEPVEQSFAQGRIWFLEQLHPGSSWHNMPFAIRLQGHLHLDALQAALHALEERHESLRTIFKDDDKIGLQIVQPVQARRLRVIDVSTFEEEEVIKDFLPQELEAPFDLRSGPVWRVQVYKTGKENYILTIVMHHIISDGWSIDNFRKELAFLYSVAVDNPTQNLTEQLTPLPIQYRDFSVWQRQLDQAEEHHRQLDYWVKELKDSQPAELFLDQPRPPMLSGKCEQQEMRIEGALYENLQHFCKEYQVTPFIVLLAAFRAAHYRLTGANDATIGAPIANRNRAELEDLIGFFVNVQCIRTKVEEEDSFEDLVHQVQSTAIAAFAHQDVPFERIVSELQKGGDLSRNPLVQIAFAVHSQANLGQFTLAKLKSEMIPLRGSSRFDLEFHLFQEDKYLKGHVLYASELFDKHTITLLLSVFHQIIDGGLRNPKMPVTSLSLGDGTSRLKELGLVQVERTNYPRDDSIINVFQQQVAANAEKTAVTDTVTKLTYAQLDKQSDRLAHWLSDQSLPVETLIGVFAKRSCETIVTFLGILKANLAYLPLDTKAPQGRINAILSSIKGPKLVLIGSGTNIKSFSTDTPNTRSVRIEEALNSVKATLTTTFPSPTNLAYVMFTSGSAGTPKGVMIEHRGIMRMVKNSNMGQHIKAPGPIAHMGNIAFDLSTWEIYSALLNGRTLICIDSDTMLDNKALGSMFIREGIVAAMMTPALLKQYLVDVPSMIAGLSVLYLGGDRLDSQEVQAVHKLGRTTVINAYGPTENSCTSTFHCISRSEKFPNGVPIGRAISNSGAYIVDSDLRLLPVGAIGELVVTGDGLARGFTNPELNEGRFVFLEIPGDGSVRGYRTGDYARCRPTDGAIEFIGRIDTQTKIRGHRIELGEIEHMLLKQQAVVDAIVVVQRQGEQDRELMSFVTLSDVPLDLVLADKTGQNEGADQVKSWEEMFDSSQYGALKDLSGSNIGRDFIGWTSMYDGSTIDIGEMNEWLDETIMTIQQIGQPRHFLEIGTGSGMILFNLGRDIGSYIGIEPSERAVAFANRAAKSVPALTDKVQVHKGTALDLGQFHSLSQNGLDSPNVIILNSVVQYFPSLEYLSKVVEDLIQLKGAQSIFFGDVRSFALYRQFQVKKAMVGIEKPDKRTLLQRMRDMERNEEELLIDPTFFTQLLAKYPHFIEGVEIMPKKMKATNELSAYRYTAIIHLRSQHNLKAEMVDIEDENWIDFKAQGFDHNSLVRILHQHSRDSVVAISNIPCGKSITERHILEALDNTTDEGSRQDDWLESARKMALLCPSLSATDLIDIARETGFRVELSWARQYSQSGGIDAVFHRYPSRFDTRQTFRFPNDNEVFNESSQILGSQPLRQQQNRETESKLHQILQAELPSYMVPKAVRILQKMPLNANGKVDRKALAESVQVRESETSLPSRLPPRNDVERAVCEEFAKVLDSAVGITDNFFDFGGHSLNVMRVAAGISKRMGQRVTVFDIFQVPTPAGVAELIALRRQTPEDHNGPWYLRQYIRKNSRATMVLVHGLSGEGAVYSPLIPHIDEDYNILIINDPFFGKADGPETMASWAQFYVDEVVKQLPSGHSVVFSGYSLGGLLAFEMARLWQQQHQVYPASIILLDPGNMDTTEPVVQVKAWPETQISQAIQVFGADQMAMIEESLKKLGPIWDKSAEPPSYAGNCLYLVSSDTTKTAVPEWWIAKCSNLEIHYLDCTHFTLLHYGTISTVSRMINEHCRRVTNG